MLIVKNDKNGSLENTRKHTRHPDGRTDNVMAPPRLRGRHQTVLGVWEAIVVTGDQVPSNETLRHKINYRCDYMVNKQCVYYTPLSAIHSLHKYMYTRKVNYNSLKPAKLSITHLFKFYIHFINKHAR